MQQKNPIESQQILPNDRKFVQERVAKISDIGERSSQNNSTRLRSTKLEYRGNHPDN